ncbi:MAG: hypothetical protein ACRD1D_17005 [Acidimicrobiales bacterium]
MSPTLTRRLPLAGAAFTLALALAACGGSEPSGTAASASGDAPAPAGASPAPEPPAGAAPPTTEAPPPEAPAAATPPAKQPATPTTKGRATAPTTPPTTAAPAAPPTTTAPVTPTFAKGQRINPTSAQVQGAITTLRQRIPLFQPTEPQLRTFADAACTSLDQGQSRAQVQSAVQQAVTYVQGASLSAADAEFAVRTVVGLRCPGYLQ